MDGQEITITNVFPMRKRRAIGLGLGTRRKTAAEDKNAEQFLPKTPVSKSSHSSRRKDAKSPLESSFKQPTKTPTRPIFSSSNALGRLRKTPQRLAAWGSISPYDSGPEIIWDNDSHSPTFALDRGKSKKLISKRSQEQLASFIKKLSNENSSRTSNASPNMFEAWMKKDDVVADNDSSRLIGKGCRKKRSILNRTKSHESNANQRVTRNRSRMLASNAMKFQEELSNFIKNINEKVLQENTDESDKTSEQDIMGHQCEKKPTKCNDEPFLGFMPICGETELSTRPKPSHSSATGALSVDSNTSIKTSNQKLESAGPLANSCRSGHTTSKPKVDIKVSKCNSASLKQELPLTEETGQKAGKMQDQLTRNRNERFSESQAKNPIGVRTFENHGKSYSSKHGKKVGAYAENATQKTFGSEKLLKAYVKGPSALPIEEVETAEPCQDFCNLEDSIGFLEDFPLDEDLEVQDVGNKGRKNQADEGQVSKCGKRNLPVITNLGVPRPPVADENVDPLNVLSFNDDLHADDVFEGTPGGSEVEKKNDLLEDDLFDSSQWSNFEDNLADLEHLNAEKENLKSRKNPQVPSRSKEENVKSCVKEKENAKKDENLVNIDNDFEDMDWEFDDGLVLGNDKNGIKTNRDKSPATSKLKVNMGNALTAKSQKLDGKNSNAKAFDFKRGSIFGKGAVNEHENKIISTKSSETYSKQKFDNFSADRADKLDIEMDDNDELFKDAWMDNLHEDVPFGDCGNKETVDVPVFSGSKSVANIGKTTVKESALPTSRHKDNGLDIEIGDWEDDNFCDDVLDDDNLKCCKDTQKSKIGNENENSSTRNRPKTMSSTPRSSQKTRKFNFKRTENTKQMHDLKSSLKIAASATSNECLTSKDAPSLSKNQQEVGACMKSKDSVFIKSNSVRTVHPNISLIEGAENKAGQLFKSPDDYDFWNDANTSKEFMPYTSTQKERNPGNINHANNDGTRRKYSAEDIARKKAEAKRKLELKLKRGSLQLK